MPPTRKVIPRPEGRGFSIDAGLLAEQVLHENRNPHISSFVTARAGILKFMNQPRPSALPTRPNRQNQRYNDQEDHPANHVDLDERH